MKKSTAILALFSALAFACSEKKTSDASSGVTSEAIYKTSDDIFSEDVVQEDVPYDKSQDRYSLYKPGDPEYVSPEEYYKKLANTSPVHSKGKFQGPKTRKEAWKMLKVHSILMNNAWKEQNFKDVDDHSYYLVKVMEKLDGIYSGVQELESRRTKFTTLRRAFKYVQMHAGTKNSKVVGENMDIIRETLPAVLEDAESLGYINY